MSVLPEFVKGQLDNLPKIDSISMFAFLGTNPDFLGAEIRGVKAERSGRESYGDNAIGYVQVKQAANICTVKAQVTPEHSTRKKAYSVTLQCNEVDERVLSDQCDNCAASLGGCKHAIALLTWVHRRSEEPAVTSVSCYWKKSKLSAVGTSLKYIKSKELGKRFPTPRPSSDVSFLHSVLEDSKHLEMHDTLLTNYKREFTSIEKLSLHHLSLIFFQEHRGNAEQFLNYCSSAMPEAACSQAADETVKQSKCSLWAELRYGRITASKAHEAAHCHTLDGSLVETILGAKCMKDNAAMRRGISLEKEVRKVIQKEKNIKIKLCGFKTSGEYPVMGASPDGISEDYVIEIKCPSNEKTIKNYIVNGQITEKHKAQMQLQMLFCKKQKGLFCVANTDFELSKQITIVVVDFDEQFCSTLLHKCSLFWKSAVFPVFERNFL